MANSLAAMIASCSLLTLVPEACADTLLPPPFPPITMETDFTHSLAVRPFSERTCTDHCEKHTILLYNVVLGMIIKGALYLITIEKSPSKCQLSVPSQQNVPCYKDGIPEILKFCNVFKLTMPSLPLLWTLPNTERNTSIWVSRAPFWYTEMMAYATACVSTCRHTKAKRSVN